MEDLRIAEYPGPLGVHDSAVIEKNVRETLLERIVTALTRSDGGAGASLASGARDQRHIVFTGTQDEITRFFEAQEWSDGLPFVAPTVERIERFLEYADRAAEEKIAVLPSANLVATPWNVAANAVMAGCSPLHMPLLLAAVEALGDERMSLNNIGSSSGIIPYVLINGPILKQLGIACGKQVVSRGPNPAIGRAVGLIVRNIAGFRPGTSYMGTFGYPLAFAFGESESESPWDPFHVEQGFDRHESTVTLGVTNNWGPAPAPYESPDRPGAQVALEMLCREIASKTRLFNFPARGPDAEHVMVTLLLSPPVAKSLANAGYSKQDVKCFIYENAKMAIRDLEWVVKYTMTARTTLRERVEAGVYPAEFLGAPDERVRIVSSPDILHVVVCGDPHRNRVMVFEGGHTRPTTKRVRLPENWPELLSKAASWVS